MKSSAFSAVTAASLLLTACGGDDTPAPPTNQPPVFTNTQLSFNYAENGTAPVTRLAINDEAASSVTLSLSGADSNDFTIVGGRDLAFVVPPNFDAPSDANADNVYRVTVTARDAIGSTGMVDITVTVTDIAGATRFIDPLFARTASLGSIAVPAGSGSVPVSFIGPAGDTMAARPAIVVGASRTAGVAQFAEGWRSAATWWRWWIAARPALCSPLRRRCRRVTSQACGSIAA